MRNSSAPVSQPLLSKTANYALRALLALARHGGGRHLAAETIAELTGAPANYLGKTLYALARAGLLRSTRGPSGGFALAVPAEEITIARVVDVFAEPPATSRCLLGARPCDPAAPCAAHERWTRIASAARDPLATTTIADLLADSAPAVSHAAPSLAPRRPSTAPNTAGAF
jgi:Rrf2 family protein